MASASPSYPYPFYYRALRFDAVRFFADGIDAGHYKLAWIAQAVATGEFAVTETHAERMYDPDVFANGVATRLKVEPASCTWGSDGSRARRVPANALVGARLEIGRTSGRERG